MAISTDLTSVGNKLNSLSAEADSLVSGASGAVASINGLVDGLPKGVSDLLSAFTPPIPALPTIDDLIPELPTLPTLPSLPDFNIEIEIPSVNIDAVKDRCNAATNSLLDKRKQIFDKFSEVQSVVPTLPSSLNDIRDAIPSIQASSLMSGLSDLKNLGSNLTNPLGDIGASIQDNVGSLGVDIAGSVSAFGSIADPISSGIGSVTGAVGSALDDALSGTALPDLTGGLTSLVGQMPGLPAGLSPDSLLSALGSIPAIPISMPEIDLNPKKYIKQVSSYVYESVL